MKGSIWGFVFVRVPGFFHFFSPLLFCLFDCFASLRVAASFLSGPGPRATNQHSIYHFTRLVLAIGVVRVGTNKNANRLLNLLDHAPGSLYTTWKRKLPMALNSILSFATAATTLCIMRLFWSPVHRQPSPLFGRLNTVSAVEYCLIRKLTFNIPFAEQVSDLIPSIHLSH